MKVGAYERGVECQNSNWSWMFTSRVFQNTRIGISTSLQFLPLSLNARSHDFFSVNPFPLRFPVNKKRWRQNNNNKNLFIFSRKTDRITPSLALFLWLSDTPLTSSSRTTRRAAMFQHSQSRLMHSMEPMDFLSHRMSPHGGAGGGGQNLDLSSSQSISNKRQRVDTAASTGSTGGAGGGHSNVGSAGGGGVTTIRLLISFQWTPLLLSLSLKRSMR